MGFVVVTPSMAAPLEGAKRWAYLARQPKMRIVSMNEDGTPFLSATWYVVHDETLYLPVDAGSGHAANFDAGRAVAAVVDSGDELTTLVEVRIRGKARAVENAKLIDALENEVFQKYFHVGHPYADPYFQLGRASARKYYALVADEMIAVDARETSTATAVESRLMPRSMKDRRLS